MALNTKPVTRQVTVREFEEREEGWRLHLANGNKLDTSEGFVFDVDERVLPVSLVVVVENGRVTRVKGDA